MSEMSAREVTDDDPYKVRNHVVILPYSVIKQLTILQPAEKP